MARIPDPVPKSRAWLALGCFSNQEAAKSKIPAVSSRGIKTAGVTLKR